MPPTQDPARLAQDIGRKINGLHREIASNPDPNAIVRAFNEYAQEVQKLLQARRGTRTFFAVTPCRAADTRSASGPMSTSETRQFKVLGPAVKLHGKP